MGQLEYDKFQKDVQDWLDNHPKEYVRFLDRLNRSENGFEDIMNIAMNIVPEYTSIINQHLEQGKDFDFDKIKELFSQNKAAEQLVGGLYEDDENMIPAFLAWLYNGKCFEFMAEKLKGIAKDANSDFRERTLVPSVFKELVQSSIDNDYRGENDWKDFHEITQALDSGDLLGWAINGLSTPDGKLSNDTSVPVKKKAGRKADKRTLPELLKSNQEKLLKKIGERLILHSTEKDIARLYISLLELRLLYPTNLTTFRNALKNYYPEQKIIDVRGIQEAYNYLTSPVKGLNKRFKDHGEEPKYFDELKEFLSD